MAKALKKMFEVLIECSISAFSQMKLRLEVNPRGLWRTVPFASSKATRDCPVAKIASTGVDGGQITLRKLRSHEEKNP